MIATLSKQKLIDGVPVAELTLNILRRRTYSVPAGKVGFAKVDPSLVAVQLSSRYYDENGKKRENPTQSEFVNRAGQAVLKPDLVYVSSELMLYDAERDKAMIAFLSNHPEVATSNAYKQLIGVLEGTKDYPVISRSAKLFRVDPEEQAEASIGYFAPKAQAFALFEEKVAKIEYGPDGKAIIRFIGVSDLTKGGKVNPNPSGKAFMEKLAYAVTGGKSKDQRWSDTMCVSAILKAIEESPVQMLEYLQEKTSQATFMFDKCVEWGILKHTHGFTYQYGDPDSGTKQANRTWITWLGNPDNVPADRRLAVDSVMMEYTRKMNSM